MYVVVVFFVRGGGGACAEPKFGDFFSEKKKLHQAIRSVQYVERQQKRGVLKHFRKTRNH